MAGAPAVERHATTATDESKATAVVLGMMVVPWAAGFGYLSVVRHLAGGSHAEDLGFTDQVIWNFLRGQWFRMSIYNGATWNTELDVSRMARPDSLLAFHVEPMLLLFVPVYALGAGAITLLIVQSAAIAAGAIPAYRLGWHASASRVAGVAVAAAYLLSPLGQWAVLDDFHTSALAVPLLLLSLERLIVAHSPVQGLLAAGLAATAREDVGPALAVLGTALALRTDTRRAGFAVLGLGFGWTIFAGLVIHSYSGGISLFDVRYGPTLAGGLAGVVSALVRPAVLQYAQTLLLSGGWLGLVAPLALAPALPSLALNVLSTSPWMAAGKAHYSSLVLPFVTVAAAMALARLRSRPSLQNIASAMLVMAALIGYVGEGGGPLGGNYAPAIVNDRANRASAIAASLPSRAAVSASASLVPHISERPRVYEFPAIEDADYVFLDVKGSPAPTSAGDVYLRVQSMLSTGAWQVQTYEDGILLLHHNIDGQPPSVSPSVPATVSSLVDPDLLSAELVPSPDGTIDIDGPRWVLRTTWQTCQPLPPGTRLEFWVDLNDGERLHLWDVADLWWNPPERWPVAQPMTIDVPDLPLREFRSWNATWTSRP